ncbi:MAG: endonuclease III domain-containing protein [Candidatus Bipolaricaulia bacterium]
MDAERIASLYRLLLATYGPQGWWPADTSWEVCVGAILTQRVAWRNAQAALEGLRRSKILAPAALASAPERAVAEAIRPALFYHSKAAKLKDFARVVVTRWGGDVTRLRAESPDTLREALLGIHGVGSETADAILVYVAHRPAFIADRYALRLFERLGWIPADTGYEAVRAAVMAAWAADADAYGELHALIVRHGKERCRPKPLCSGCPLASLCSLPERSGGAT